VTLRALDLLEAAKALGLTVPDKLLATADEVTRLSRIAIFGIPGLNAAQFAATETAVRALALEAETMKCGSARRRS